MWSQRSYTVEERFTIDVTLRDTETFQPAWSSYAINEVSIEKAARERMLEVLVEVDGRPLSRWACDGMLVSTPTGSTAYAFSAGGPVVWPGVEALVVVPLSAHALFARPLVLSPTSTVVVEVLDVSPTHGVVLVRRAPLRRIADGHGDRSDRGTAAAATSSTLSGPLHRSAGPEIRSASGGLARLGRPGHHHDRHSCMITELRIADLGVISDAIDQSASRSRRGHRRNRRRQDDDHQRARPAARRPG